MKDDHQTCRFCGAPLSPKSHEICGAVECLLKRNAEVARRYMEQNRERVNERRRLRYQEQRHKQLSKIQGAALHALWREQYLVQCAGVTVSASTLHHVCALSTIQSLAKKGLAARSEDKWIPVLQPDEFEAQGYTISNYTINYSPKHKP